MREAIARHGDHIVQRVFTSLEITYCQAHKNAAERFAARFAAKEAAMKALGTGWREGVTWKDFEIANEPTGKPILRLTGRAAEIYGALGGTRLHLSLTHTQTVVFAQVVIES
jgi:holo-[acyl-carrier protein] synthase